MPRVLIVDDAEAVRALVADMLTRAGYQVTTTIDGRKAVEMLRVCPFDLVITDIYMPEEDGLELLRECSRTYPTMPVIAMSGLTGHMNMLHVASVFGASQTLQKPFEEQDLLRAVSATLASASQVAR